MSLTDIPKKAGSFREMGYKLPVPDNNLAGGIRKSSPGTNIYHISYTPQTKEVSLFFWGCNFSCRGCPSKKGTGNYLLPENIHLFRDNPAETAQPPVHFLSVADVLSILGGLDIQTVLFEGQEPSLDESLPQLAKLIHTEFKTQNILCSNINKLVSLDDIDCIQLSLKAVTDSLHLDYTGKSNRNVLNNLKYLHAAGKKLSIASVLIPGYIDKDEIELIAGFISDINRGLPFNILPYFKAGQNKWRCPTISEMEDSERIAQKYLTHVYAWRGDEEIKYEVMKIY
ncbi:MAG: radical SAM protein [Dehalococcoides mccartyi]|uniref:radical SAM protein n=1 Tax=Dehalococcoides TaxID=61434 RepID=UPI002737A402|nr:radical SAM protein [Dehalococcoides mccartyi]MDP4279361.1 radical SAM protein [Dehalococcoides mccartyi]